MKTSRNRTADALDRTHQIAYRGPRTLQARSRLALWLDTGQGTGRQVAIDTAWLLAHAAAEPER